VAWHQFSMFQSLGVHRPRAGRASISSCDQIISRNLIVFAVVTQPGTGMRPCDHHRLQYRNLLNASSFWQN
jgi:hypothetical protein